MSANSSQMREESKPMKSDLTYLSRAALLEGTNDRTGVGLGLTISKQAVEASGGILIVRDISDIGCIFAINLPRQELPT